MMSHGLADWLAQLFGHLCGQGRCFDIAGQSLPLCQRCLGLYVGAALTVAWLLAAGLWRSGLPSRRVLAIHAAALVVAGLGGLHVIDPGPRWRLACGLLSGHVIAWWLLIGLASLWGIPRSGRRRRLTDATAIGFPPAMIALALAWPCLHGLGWSGWTMLACAGIISLLVSAACTVGALVSARLRCGRRRAGWCGGGG